MNILNELFGESAGTLVESGYLEVIGQAQNGEEVIGQGAEIEARRGDLGHLLWVSGDIASCREIAAFLPKMWLLLTVSNKHNAEWTRLLRDDYRSIRARRCCYPRPES